MNDAPPLIETPRLRLRGHRYEDLAACIAMWSDPEVVRFIGGRASTEQQTWSRVQGYVGHWRLLGFGYWAFEDKASGEFAGEGGFADFKRAIAPQMRDVPELGFALVPRFHGRGYAGEAVEAIVRWGDMNLPSRRTVCIVSPGNAASRRVVEKAGYAIFEESLFNDEPVLFFERYSPPNA